MEITKNTNQLNFVSDLNFNIKKRGNLNNRYML